jgi:RHS repeat-associated protein
MSSRYKQHQQNHPSPNTSTPNEPFRYFMVFAFLVNILIAMIPPGSLAAAAATLPLPESAAASNLTPANQTQKDKDQQSLTAKKTAKALATNSPLNFEANTGQSATSVKYLARGRGYSIFFTDQPGATLNLRKLTGKEVEPPSNAKKQPQSQAQNQPQTPAERNLGAKGLAIRMALVGASANASVTTEEPLAGKVNYMVGSDANSWRTGVSSFGQIAYTNVYSNIDLKFYGNQNQLEYDFIVRPGGDVNRIAVRYEGVGKLDLTAKGELELGGAGGNGNGSGNGNADNEKLVQPAPVIYQTIGGSRVSVTGEYVLRGTGNNREVGFRITGNYNRDYPLVIDPLLSYSTYLGGDYADDGPDMVVDASGNAYLTGFTAGSDFPVTTGAYSTTYGGGSLDAFVTKLSANGGSLIYSTFIGGNGADYGRDLAVDSQGQVHFTGFTSSTNFPTTTGARQTTYGGGANDAFVVKLNAAGSGLLYSSYLGSSGDDKAFSVGVRATDGHIFVYGQTVLITATNNFPTTTGAYRTTPIGSDDTFVARFSPTGGGASDLVYSTYYGGIGFDIPTDLAVDTSGNAYFTGYTTSITMPTTTGAFQTAYGGGDQDAFVAKLNSTGTALSYSTFLGGSGSETGHDLVVASDGTVYLVGDTSSANFGTTTGAVQTALAGSDDVFVVRLNAAGSARLYSSYLGGSGSDKGYGIALDGQGNVYLSGITASSTNFPTTPGAFQTVYGGGTADAFLSVLAVSTGTTTTLGYSSYLGGSGHDFARDIAIDSVGNPYLNGGTASADFPVTSGAYQTEPGGSTDIFLTKFALTRLVFAQQPTQVVVGQNIAPAVTVNVVNFLSQVITSYTQPVSVTVVPGTGAADATLSGTTTANAVSGVVTFSNLSLNRVGAGYQLQAMSGSLFLPVISQSFEVITNVLTPVLQIVEGSPQSVVINNAFAKPLKVRLTQNGTPVVSKTVTFTAPATGASGTFAGGGGGGSPTYAGTTNSSGEVTTPVFTANGSYGVFYVVATASEAPSSVQFILANLAQSTDTYNLKLDPPVSGPHPLGSVVTLTATLKRHDIVTVTNVPITITITSQEGSASTATVAGSWVGQQAVFTYTRNVTTTDNIIASAIINGNNISSQISTIYWLLPYNELSLGTVYGNFFDGKGRNGTGCYFGYNQGDTPRFTQRFNNLWFDGWEEGSSINPYYGQPGRTDNFLTDVQGNIASPDRLIVQGNGYSPGSQAMGASGSWQAVFTGTLVVTRSGVITFGIRHDSGFVLGVNKGATIPSGAPNPLTENPLNRTATPFLGYPIMSVYEKDNGYGNNLIAINFPAAGVYDYELDFAECGSTHSELYVYNQAGGSVRPAASLSLSPVSVANPLTTGQPVTFTASVMDASGTRLKNWPINLVVEGANGRVLVQNTDATTGIATFVFTGTVEGADRVIATSFVKGPLTFSAVTVDLLWQAPGGGTGGGTGGAPGCTNAYTSLNWFTSPASRSDLSVSTPLTLARKVDNAQLDYWRVVDPNKAPTAADVVSLPLNGGGTSFLVGQKLADFDATKLANGAYVLRLCGTDPDQGNAKFATLTLVSVVGENKPGRVAFDVTDFTVPVAGMPIVIGRTYDSLERGKSGDFGYGWNLSVSSPKLEVSPAKDVTLTLLDGRRVKFAFTPTGSIFMPALLTVGYTGEPGVYGSFSSLGEGPTDCPIIWATFARYTCGSMVEFDPDNYLYRDPYGRLYKFGRTAKTEPFKLTSLTDLTGNTLKFADDGIRATNLTGDVNGGNRIVLFDRDGEKRITKITDPAGKEYNYYYASSTGSDATIGDLIKVELPENMPGVTPAQPISTTYTYHTGGDFAHFFKEAKDPRGNRAAKTEYYTTGADSGRLKNVTDALGEVYSYTYSFNAADGTNTTFVTNPDGGVSASKANSYGKIISASTDIRTTSADAPRWRITQSGYDANRNQITQTLPIAKADGSGPRTITYTYDIRGNREKVYSPHAAAIPTPTVTTYGPYGGPLSITDPTGRAVAVGYDENFMPTEVNDGRGYVGGYTFDARGSILARKDGNGNSTSFEYDQFGNKKKETDPLGNSTNYEYDTLGRIITATDALGVRSVNRYDALGRVTQTTVAYGTPVSATTSYEYDANGNQRAVIDPLGRRTEYTYDAANRVIETKYADNTTVRQRYDWRGSVISTTDQLGRTTLSRYDLSGQLISTTVAAGTSDAATTVHEYDDAGRKVREYNPYSGGGSLPANQKYTRSQYDDADRLITSTNQLGHSTVFTYDGANRKIAERDALGRVTSYEYDTRGQLQKTLQPPLAGGVVLSTTQNYDLAGRVLTRTDAAGIATLYDYYDNGWLRQVSIPITQAQGNYARTSYQYDKLGRLRFIQDANLHSTEFTYDEQGRQSQKIWPDRSFEEWKYDAAGNMTRHRLADGNANLYDYDSLNRLKQLNYFDGKVVTHTYTLVGQKETVKDYRGITSYTYDAQDRVTGVIQAGTGLTITYGYNVAGQRTSLTTKAGAQSYGYDDAYRLTSVVSPYSSVPTTYTYDALGMVRQISMTNGVRVDHTYDALNRLTNIHQYKAIPQTLAAYTYTIGAGGNRTAVSEYEYNASAANPITTRQNSWGYDDAYRLITETRQVTSTSALTTLYSYDKTGNRLAMKVGSSPIVAYNYNELDQLTGVISNGITTQYGYDRRGNLKQVGTGANATVYTWDAADRLIGATLPGGATSSMEYDAGGRRTKTILNGTTTNYLWHEFSQYSDVILETNVSNQLQIHYVLANGGLILQKRNSDSSPSYFLKDGQNSTRALISSDSGSITESYAYDAYGNLAASSTLTPTTNYLYAGQQLDKATGMYSLRARYYNPGEGRFPSRDTFILDTNNPVELNRYLYTANNPINYYDPSGFNLTEQNIVLGRVHVPGNKGVALLKVAKGTKNYDTVLNIGTSFALKAKRANIEVRKILKAEGFSDARIGGMMKQVTNAYTELKSGQKIVALNSGTSDDVLKAFKKLYSNDPNVIVHRGLTEHAEVAAHKKVAELTGARTNDDIADFIDAIGISHSRGPCKGGCRISPEFQDGVVPIFWLGPLRNVLATLVTTFAPLPISLLFDIAKEGM